MCLNMLQVCKLNLYNVSIMFSSPEYKVLKVSYCDHTASLLMCIACPPQQLLLTISLLLNHCVNPFPHIDAFWRLCSRQLFENIVTKEEIAQNKQFLLLTQCVQMTLSHRLSIQLKRFSCFCLGIFKCVMLQIYFTR